MKILAKVLRTQRTKAKLTQKALAEKANIKQPYYSDIERGLCAPSLKTCLKLSVVLGFSMDDLKESVMEELN